MPQPLKSLAAGLLLAIHASAGLIPILSPRNAPPPPELSVELPSLASPPAAYTVLQPFRRALSPNPAKRSLIPALTPQNSSTFGWIGADGTLAEFTIETPDDSEAIVNLELLDSNDFVRGIQCPRAAGAQTGRGDLKIKFAEEADLDEAADVWGWVNQEARNHFLLVLGVGECDWKNEERLVYRVEGVEYDNGNETAILKVVEAGWGAVKTFDLVVGTAGSAERRAIGIFDDIKKGFEDAFDKVKDVADDIVDGVKKVASDVKDVAEDIASPELRPDFTVPFDHRLSNMSIPIPVGNLTITAQCKECFTTGAFDVKGRFRAENLKMVEAWVEMSTRGVSARAVVGLGLRGALTEKLFEKTIPLFAVSPAGITIPGVLTIGPTISVDLGFEVSEIMAGVNIVMGGTAVIPPSSSRLDFLSKAGSGATGWTPEFKAEPFHVDGFVEVRASAFLKPAVGLEISVLETGLLVEVAAKAPALSASLKAVRSLDCTTCGTFENGLQGDLSLGASVGASVRKKTLGVEESLFGLTFVNAQFPIAGFCQGFGQQGDACLAN